MLHNYINSTLQDENSWELNDNKTSVVTVFRRRYKNTNELKFPAVMVHVYSGKNKSLSISLGQINSQGTREDILTVS